MKTQVHKLEFKYLLIIILFLISNVAFAHSGVKKIDSLDYSSDSSNFLSFDNLTQNNQIIGIGESAHASKGFMQARGRLVKYFVKNHGYRLVLLETGFIGAEKANDYLNLCRKSSEHPDDLKKAWKSLYAGYRTTETIEMLEWLCEFNKTSSTPVQFHGMDQWEDPWVQRDIIKNALTEIDSPRFQKLYDMAEENCYAWSVNSWKEAEEKGLWDYLLKTWRLDPEENRVCLGTLYNMQNILERVVEPTEKMTWAFLATKVFYVYQTYRDIFVSDISRALNMRDDLQAFLVESWMNKYPGKKALLLEHNVHISRAQSQIEARDLGSRFKWQNVVSTGENLIGRYGASYKSIGITGYKVSRTRDGQYPILNQEGSLDYQLSKLGEILYVDPQAKWIKIVKNWWMHNEFSPMYLNPGKQYDALLFMKESPSAIILD